MWGMCDAGGPVRPGLQRGLTSTGAFFTLQRAVLFSLFFSPGRVPCTLQELARDVRVKQEQKMQHILFLYEFWIHFRRFLVHIWRIWGRMLVFLILNLLKKR